MFVVNRVESVIQVFCFAIRFVGISLPAFTKDITNYKQLISWKTFIQEITHTSLLTRAYKRIEVSSLPTAKAIPKNIKVFNLIINHYIYLNLSFQNDHVCLQPDFAFTSSIHFQ